MLCKEYLRFQRIDFSSDGCCFKARGVFRNITPVKTVLNGLNWGVEFKNGVFSDII